MTYELHLVEELQAAREEVTRLKADYDALTKQKAEFFETFERQRDEIARLKAELTFAQQQQRILLELKEELREENEGLKAELAQLRQGIAEREHLACYIVSEATKPKLENRDLREENALLSSQLESAREALRKIADLPKTEIPLDAAFSAIEIAEKALGAPREKE